MEQDGIHQMLKAPVGGLEVRAPMVKEDASSVRAIAAIQSHLQ
jgi:hypothetical protein